MRDVIIIGGGAIGCAVARELACYKLDILLLEMGSDVCVGTSRSNTAIVHAGYDAEPGTLKAKFNLLGNPMFDALCKELDVPFRRNASTVVAFSPEEMETVRALRDKALENGVPGVRILDEAALRALEPNIGSAAKGALYAPTGGIVCPYELTVAMAESAALRGVDFEMNTKVTGLRKKDRAWVVETNGSAFETRMVINCAGLYADELNNMVSADTYAILPRRGEYIIVDKRYAAMFTTSVFQAPLQMATGHTKGILVTPTVDGTLLLGPTAEDVDNKEDTRNTAFGFDKILSNVRKTWNSLPYGDFIGSYAGLRAHCDRDDFVLGEPADAPGFYNVGGIESPGLTSAPALGVHVAEQVSGRLNARRKEQVACGRGDLKRFREMTHDERREAIAADPAFGQMVCRCEMVTEAEVRDAIRRPVGARTVDAVKRRTRAGMGRCQGGFCGPRVLEILCDELKLSPTEITKSGAHSQILTDRACSMEGGRAE